MGPLLRRSLVAFLALALSVNAAFGAAGGRSSSLASGAKPKGGKQSPAPENGPPPSRAGRASARSRPKAKSHGAAVAGNVAVFGFKGESAARLQQAVVSALRTHGLQVTTSLRPVDTAEQYREMAATLQLAAYIDGAVVGDGPRGRAIVNVRSGITGRRVASVRFSGGRAALADNVGSALWPRAGGQLTRLCAAASRPRKLGRGTLRIDAGTPLENTPREDLSDLPPHLRNDPPKEAHKDDPWADEGT